MKMDGLQFIGHQVMGIQKLSKSWQLLTKNPNDPSGYELTQLTFCTNQTNPA